MHGNTHMHIIPKVRDPASLVPRPFHGQPPVFNHLQYATAKTGCGNGLGTRLGSKTLRFSFYWELVVIVEHSNVW